MIRLLHFADVHIGVENYGRTDPETGVSSRVRDFLRRLDEMIRFAGAHDVDLVIFAGDAFKNHQPNPTFQREFAYRIGDLAALCPVLLLVGNHDLPAVPSRASSVEIYDTLNVPNVKVAMAYEVLTITTKSGPVQVATAPYPIRAKILENYDTRGMTIAQVDTLLQNQLQLILRGLAKEVAGSEAPRVLTGHFTVAGALAGSERNIMMGRDTSVLLSELADSVWDYVAMGHIHKHQNLTRDLRNQPPVVYSGSLERVDFGEEDDPKGFCWVELERGRTRWEFVPVSARPFATIHANVRGSLEPTEDVLAAIATYRDERGLEDAVVRVIIQADVDTEPKLREADIQRALHEANVSFVAAIQKDVERPVRSRLGTSPDGMTALDMLRHYFESKRLDEDRIERLLSQAEAFLGE
ncbi:MAG TPA: exonuclease SbcCD subunit D [Aggregatilineales bacterium]|nr:exonuclease SbcCD subunit D [Aggregatilineales bacterium]